MNTMVEDINNRGNSAWCEDGVLKALGEVFTNSPKSIDMESPSQSMGTWKQNLVDESSNVIVIVECIVFRNVHNSKLESKHYT